MESIGKNSLYTSSPIFKTFLKQLASGKRNKTKQRKKGIGYLKIPK